MKKGALIVGILCGVVCAACVFMYSSLVRGEADSARAEAMERYGGEQVEVLVATKDIYPGETLSSANSTTKTWLSDLLPEECVTNLADVKDVQVSSMIAKGEAISKRRFESSSASIEVPQGCVALSVAAQDVQAVGGSLRTGCLVDVYATGSQTACIGKNILVLATNVEGSSSSKSKVSWVTLAVPLEQSQEFVTASQSMDIYFVLPAQSSDSSDASQGGEGASSGESSGGGSSGGAAGGSADSGASQNADSTPAS